MFLATVVVETYGAIPNRDVHVRGPLARIIAQAFAYAVRPTERILPEAVQIRFNETIRLEPGILAAIYISTNVGNQHVTDVEELQKAIESAIDQSAMFKCRTTSGAVQIQLHLGVAVAMAQS